MSPALLQPRSPAACFLVRVEGGSARALSPSTGSSLGALPVRRVSGDSSLTESTRYTSWCVCGWGGGLVSSLPVIVLADRAPPRPRGAVDRGPPFRTAHRARGKVTAACPYFSEGQQAYVESDTHLAPASVEVVTKKGSRPRNKPFGCSSKI